MAEIEHFFDPIDCNFDLIQPEMNELIIPIWTEDSQLSGNALSAIPICDINGGTSSSSPSSATGGQIINYYLYKMFDFCNTIGIDTSKVRFREQLQDELAHYATVCYDLERDVNWSNERYMQGPPLKIWTHLAENESKIYFKKIPIIPV